MEKVKSDIEIATGIIPKHIALVAKEAGISESTLELYGYNKAKIDFSKLGNLQNKGNKKSKLVLVTAISPTPMGEGKTTTTIGLGDALRRLGEKTIVALREPSLGPVFGVKGGATGGGYAQVIPMEDINLHFTGDFHAITSANNLLSAMIDNHIWHGNELELDTTNITWKRVMDMNDRALRNVELQVKSKNPESNNNRADGFDITVASEIMAILCLCNDIHDLKVRLGNIIIGFNIKGEPITASDVNAHGAMTVLLKNAIKPNLVQTLEGTPAIIHGGPFANIAHGCNSVIATKTALGLADYTVTEAGFGADLGMEKFINIKCPKLGRRPDVIVLVATIRALKFHGGGALQEGIKTNLFIHIDNIRNIFGLNVVVAINKFTTDTLQEIDLVKEECNNIGIQAVVNESWACGGKGAEHLASTVINACNEQYSNEQISNNSLYLVNDTIENKIKAIATKIYRTTQIEFTKNALLQVAKIKQLPNINLPICIARPTYILADMVNASQEKKPIAFGMPIKITSVKLNAGARFIVAKCGTIMTMPGLPKITAAQTIDIDSDGNTIGLF
ncbi:MAG: formate--tetrahydrofolate ligase [Firmicutes bacterium]|nr:formate--tetrahydrofolate ligase [Bacillota bacterium]